MSEKIPLVFAKTKTICPHCQGKSYVKLTSHSTGGKCHKCGVFDKPGNSSPFTFKDVPPTPNEQTNIPVERREHIYHTVDGEPLLKVKVLKFSNGDKSCPQFRWNGKEWKPGGLASKDLTLYDAPILKLLQAAPQAQKDSTSVYIVEGEKDCEALKTAGKIATCNPMGAGKWMPHYNELLRGLNVVILPDNDKPGREHGAKVFQTLQRIAASVKIVNLWELMPDLMEKGDVSDFIAAGGNIADVIAKAESTPIEQHSPIEQPAPISAQVTENAPEKTKVKESFFVCKTMNQIIAEGKSKPPMLQMFGNLWRRGQSCILFATDGAGKTTLAVQIAEAIARGESVCELFPNECTPQRVLYFDFEFSDIQHANRYTVAGTSATYQFSENLLRVALNLERPDLIPENIERVIIPEIAELAKKHGAEVLVIDNVSALLAESEKSSVAGKLMKRLQLLKTELGVSLMMIGHTPKRDGTRILTTSDLAGSKQLTNLIDNTICIGKLPDEAETRYLKHVKSRDGAPQYTTFNVVKCDIKQRPDGFLQIVFGDTANEIELLKIDAPAQAGVNPLERAKAFLLRELANGAVPSATIQEKLKAEKIPWNKYTDAKKELGVISVRHGENWEMFLPPGLLPDGDTEHKQGVKYCPECNKDNKPGDLMLLHKSEEIICNDCGTQLRFK